MEFSGVDGGGNRGHYLVAGGVPSVSVVESLNIGAAREDVGWVDRRYRCGSGLGVVHGYARTEIPPPPAPCNTHCTSPFQRTTNISNFPRYIYIFTVKDMSSPPLSPSNHISKSLAGVRYICPFTLGIAFLFLQRVAKISQEIHASCILYFDIDGIL